MNRYASLAKHVRQMLFESDGLYRFSGSGSCFLLRYGNTNYVLTAKHVTKGYNTAQIRVMINPESPTGDVHCFSLTRPFAFARHEGVFFEDFFVASVDDNDLDCEFWSLFFRYQPVCDCHYSVNPSNRLLIVGFPDENQCIDYDASKVVGQATTVLATDISKRGDDFGFELTLSSDCKLPSYSGFSGAPVFSHSCDNIVRVVGLVLQGCAHERWRVLKFLDIRAIIAGIEYHCNMRHRDKAE